MPEHGGMGMGKEAPAALLVRPGVQGRHRRTVRVGDRSVGQLARDFDLTETAVREWVKQAAQDAGTRQDGGLTTWSGRNWSGCAANAASYVCTRPRPVPFRSWSPRRGLATVSRQRRPIVAMHDDSDAMRRSTARGRTPNRQAKALR
jgi:hypothetical protein